MSSVSSARREWEEGSRRFFEAARDPARADVLHQQLDAVTVELRRRVGGTFTLAELAEAYASSERWVLQTVEERVSPRYYRLIKAFGDKTGVPIVLNTSFNENEPIVMTPEHAVETFAKTKMDLLVVGNLVVSRG